MFNFLDFLTIPAYMVTLVMFCAMLALGDYRKSVGGALLTLFESGGIFVLGYLFTWVSKWLLTCCFLDPSTVLANVAGEMEIWTTADTFETDQRLYHVIPWAASVLGSMYYAVANSPAGIIGVAVTFCCIIIAVVARIRLRKTGSCVPSKLWRLCFPAAAVPICLAIMMSHTALHLLIFPYKNWSIVMAIVSAICLQYAVDALRKNGSKSVQHTAEGDSEHALGA